MRFDLETIRKHMQTFNGLFRRQATSGGRVYLKLEECEAIHILVGFISAGENHGVQVFSSLKDAQVFALMQEGIENFGLVQPNLLAMVLSNLEFYEQTLERDVSRQERLLRIATYLLGEIISKHPFLDGNKRTGFVVATLFLRLNGLRLKAYRLKDAAGTLSNIAQGKLSADQVYDWLHGFVDVKP